MSAEPLPSFEATSGSEGGVVVVCIRGEVDMATAPELAAHLDDAASASGPVLIDLCGVTFMDSTGLRALVRGRSRITEQGRKFGVACGPSKTVARLLSISGVGQLFAQYGSRAQGVDALRG